MEAWVYAANNSVALTALAAVGSLLIVAISAVQWLTARSRAKRDSTLDHILTEISARKDIPSDIRDSVQKAHEIVSKKSLADR
jgi:hypothetical protein